nr:hypothetical protein [Tanacetum cinerariifolium]
VKGKEKPNQSHLYLRQLLKKTVIQKKLREIRICKKTWHLMQSTSKGSTNLRTSLNSRHKHVDTSLRYVKDNQTGLFGNQRTVNVAGARETVGSQVVQQNGIQCFNCKEFGHFAKECKKPKRAEKVDWLEDKGEEVDEQELEAHYSFMANIQEVLPTDLGTDAEPLEKVQYDDEYNVFANEKQHSEQHDSINNTFVVEKVDRNVIPDSPDMCDNNDQAEQNAKECDDERDVLANLIANLTLDVEENKKILKQLKKAKTSLSQELKECKYTLEETTKALGESNSTRDICLIALQSHKVELEKYKTYLNHPIENDKLELERKYLDQLARANEIRKNMWRKSFVKPKPNIGKNISFLPTQKSLSKSKQAYNVMIQNINLFKTICDQAWQKHVKDHFYVPTAKDMSTLVEVCLMPLAIKTQNDSFIFVEGFTAVLVVLITGASQSKQYGKSESVSYYLPD